MRVKGILIVVVTTALLGGVVFVGKNGISGARQSLSQMHWEIGRALAQDKQQLRDVMLEMRDGVRLATDIYLPQGSAGPTATILVRLPYGKTRFGDVRYWVDVFTPRGYAVVAQDMRGRHGSEGEFAPYPNAGRDASDTLDWIIAQEWSNGRVGTIGCSALGETQVILAAERHRAHQAMIPIGAGGAIGTAAGRHGFFGAFEGGIFALASGFGWFVEAGGKSSEFMDPAWVDYASATKSLPLAGMVGRYRDDPTDFDAFVTGFENTGLWNKWGYITDDDVFSTPALMVDTWYDPNVSATLALSKLMRDSGAPGQSVLIAPGTHCNYSGASGSGFVGEVPVAPNAMLPFEQMFADFMGNWLGEKPAPDLPPYRYYVMIEDQWRDAEIWPPAAATTISFVLGSEGSANTSHGDGWLRIEGGAAAQRDVFTSDPDNPVPTLGGAICCTGDPDLKIGPIAQNAIEGREDILVYTSEPLAEKMRLVGPITARLQVSADVPDTDLIVRLTDVLPDGQSRTIREGALRLRYRNGYTAPEMMQEGEVYSVEVSLNDIAYLVEPGHRLRLHVAGSSFPRLARNLNTGGNNYDEAVGRKANVWILTGGTEGSSLRLSVLPD